MSPATKRLRVAFIALLLLFVPGGASRPVSAAADVCTQAVTNGTFEAGSTGWTQQSAQGAALIDDFYPLNGIYGAYLGGTNNASDHLFQNISLPTSATAILRFWWALSTQEPAGAFDTLTIALYTPDGATKLATLLLIDNSLSNNWDWNLTVIDLGPYAGQNVRLRFSATTDAAIPTSFYLDDVSVQVCTTAQVRRFLPLLP